MVKKIIKNKKNAYKLLNKIREILRIIYNKKTRSRFFWNLRNGDEKISLSYPLNTNSIVFDIGAYNGTFTKKIYKKYNCNIFAFEPLQKYYTLLTREFANDKNKIRVFNFGLLDKDETINFSNIEHASSIYFRPEGELSIDVKMKSFDNFIKQNNINFIDLVYMNIEGSEYRLLQHIINSGNIEKIKFLQVQFHNFVENSNILRNEIRQNLMKTHECIHNFPFIWEVWKIKSI